MGLVCEALFDGKQLLLIATTEIPHQQKRRVRFIQANQDISSTMALYRLGPQKNHLDFSVGGCSVSLCPCAPHDHRITEIVAFPASQLGEHWHASFPLNYVSVSAVLSMLSVLVFIKVGVHVVVLPEFQSGMGRVHSAGKSRARIGQFTSGREVLALVQCEPRPQPKRPFVFLHSRRWILCGPLFRVHSRSPPLW